MSTRSLFLAWQSRNGVHRWFPIGLLEEDNSRYQFRYTKGALRAQKEAHFIPLLDFPQLEKHYSSPELFALYQNRLMRRSRPDFPDFLKSLDLPEQAHPMEILSVSGGHRVTDPFAVFPRIKKNADNSFQCRFLLHGLRHNPPARERLNHLKAGEQLHVALDPNNPATGLTVQLQTDDHHTIGWAPPYLIGDLLQAMTKTPKQLKARVVQVSSLPEPAQKPLFFLIELHGFLGEHQPMSAPDFQPLVD